MSTLTAQAIKKFTPPDYLPESDGEPMAETDVHRKQMIGLLDALDDYFRSDPDVYVTGNIFLYPTREMDETRTPVSPDIFVVKGIAKSERRVYNMEKEGKAPDLVIELTSRHTATEDLGNKRVIYAKLGVREYFVFDPLQETSSIALRGFRLQAGEYFSMVGARLHSEVLGMDLVVEHEQLRLYESKTGMRLLNHQESEAARRAAEAKAAKEAEARRIAEAKTANEAEARHQAEVEIARLQTELARLQQGK